MLDIMFSDEDGVYKWMEDPSTHKPVKIYVIIF